MSFVPGPPQTGPFDRPPPPIENEIPISELPLAGPILGAELVAIVQNGISCRITAVALTEAAAGPQGPQGPLGGPGPAGPAGPVGPQGPAALTALIVGQFGVSKTPADLPTNGVIPVNWDAAGVPPAQITMQLGEALVYTVNQHVWAYVGTSVNVAGWVDLGAVQGPQGPTGPTGPTGPAGPNAVSTDAGNSARLGSDHLIYVAVPAASGSAPLMDGTANAGASAAWSRGDHVHPTDTTRYAASNPAGYITAAGAPVQSVATRTGNIVLTHNDITDWATAVAGIAQVNPNRLINGDIRIDQRGFASGAGATANGYTVDRWAYSGTVANKVATFRSTGTPNPFPYSLQLISQSAYAVTASDTFYIQQAIEADVITDFLWGIGSGGQSVTLSFWAATQTPLTGTFSGAILNYAGTRSYPFTFNIPAATTFFPFSITIPPDNAGTWVLTGNGGGLIVRFDLGSGSTFRGTAGAWASANHSGATGSVNLVATTGAQLFITGVKLELGSLATAYPQQSLTKSLADCQRYFCKTYNANVAPQTASTESTALGVYLGPTADATCSLGVNWAYPVTMRAAPTVSLASPHTGLLGFAGAKVSGADLAASATIVSDNSAFLSLSSASVNARDTAIFHAQANAEL